MRLKVEYQMPLLAAFTAVLAPQNQIASNAMTEHDDFVAPSDESARLTGLQERRGMIAVVSVMMAAVAVMLTVVSQGFANQISLMVLALLAVLGIFFVFALLAGHIHIGERMPAARFASTISEHLDDATLVTGRNGQIMWSNAAFRDLVRSRPAPKAGGARSKSSISLKTILGHTPEAVEAMYRLSRAADDGAFHCEEIRGAEFVPEFNRGLRGSGASQPYRYVYRVTVRPYVDGAQTAAKTVEYGTLAQWTIVDISEQRAREQNAIANLTSELQMYNSLPIGSLAIRRDGTVGHINATLNTWLGHKSTPVTVAKPQELSDVITPEAAEVLLRTLAQAEDRRNKEPAKSDETIVTELDLVDAKGRVMPVRVTGKWDQETSNYLLALAKLTGASQGLADGTNTDASVQRFFQSAPFGIATIDINDGVINSNTAFTRLILDDVEAGERDGSIVELLTRHVDPDVHDAVKAGLQQVKSGFGNVAPIEITVGEDRAHTRRVYMQPLTAPQGSPEAAVLYVVDVTEHKALEEQFAQSHKMEAVGKLAGGIAHDFNNVLTAIIGFSDLLLQTHRPTDPAHKDIMNIKQSADRAAGLVGKLLAFSRRQTFQTEVMHLGDNIADWAQFLKRSIGEKIDLTIKSDRDLWLVKSDKTQIEQVITNLCVNARDAMQDGGKLTINTRNVPERVAQKLSDKGLPIGEYVLIEVADTGVGISDELQSKIFEPFFTTKDVGEGTGLGLSTVYGIVRQAGGFLILDSELGRGTTFRIYMPRYDDIDYDHALETEKKKKKKERPRDLTGTGRVLLVEDEDIVRQFAVRALKRQGYEVLEAGSGVEALEVMRQQDGKVDIVVSDVVMPEMDGPTLLKELRKKNPDLKIIFVSGYPNEAFQEALGQEKFGFLPKPFSLPALAAKVKEELAA